MSLLASHLLQRGMIWMLVTFVGMVVYAGSSDTTEQFYARSSESQKDFPGLPENAIVDVYYMEYVLTSWLLEGSAWNAYHSGMGFAVTVPGREQQQHYHTEFIPRITSAVRHVLVPTIEYSPSSPSVAWLPQTLQGALSWFRSDYTLSWQNEGGVFFHDHWPEKYTNLTRVGRTTGALFNKMRPWFFEYQKNHRTFEPVEIVDTANGRVLEPSRLCHDLFYNAIDRMYELGFRPNPDGPIFRDHIILFTKSIRRSDFEEDKRAIVRFYRLYDSFIHEINKEFSNIRSLFMSTFLLSVQPFMFKAGEYYEVQLGSPYVNYCYMEVIMPPGKKAALYKNEKLCALGADISPNMTRTFLGHLTPRHSLFLLESAMFSYKLWVTIFGIYLIRRLIKRRRA